MDGPTHHAKVRVSPTASPHTSDDKESIMEDPESAVNEAQTNNMGELTGKFLE